MYKCCSFATLRHEEREKHIVIASVTKRELRDGADDRSCDDITIQTLFSWGNGKVGIISRRSHGIPL